VGDTPLNLSYAPLCVQYTDKQSVILALAIISSQGQGAQKIKGTGAVENLIHFKGQEERPKISRWLPHALPEERRFSYRTLTLANVVGI
jgi:hypothetical protein